MSTAEQLDPVSSNLQSDFGRMLYRARIYDEAERHLDRAIQLDENDLASYDRLADVMVEQGRFDEALATLQRADSKGGGEALKKREAILFARRGEPQKAREIWDNISHKTSGDLA